MKDWGGDNSESETACVAQGVAGVASAGAARGGGGISAKHAKGLEMKTRRGASDQLRRSGIFVEGTHLESTQPRRGGNL